MRETHRGVVHLQALEDLLLRQLGRRVAAEPESHAAVGEPPVVPPRRVLGHLAHRGVQGRLRESLLEEAHPMEQVVGDDRVVHPHAAFVEDSEDRLVAGELFSQRESPRAVGFERRERLIADRLRVARVVLD